MDVLLGTQALSEFRHQHLCRDLTHLLPASFRLHTRWVYLFESHTPLSQTERHSLRTLLQAPASSTTPPGSLTLVTPRLGTRSPWSSKATDILHIAGLSSIEKIERGLAYWLEGCDWNAKAQARLYDRMTESVLHSFDQTDTLFAQSSPAPHQRILIHEQGRDALVEANTRLGLALSDDELDYLATSYQDLERDPTDVELMMFAQANSEHCRHKIFNASWTIDGKDMPHSLFAMIKHTHAQHPQGVLSAYHDNAAVIEGSDGIWFYPESETHRYLTQKEPVHILMKVETHNHPTAISPYPGAATGSGGEIRDEGATGRGGKPKAGLVGFSVSHLRLPQLPQAWESPEQRPTRIASPLSIMLDGPLGSANFNNEFGRPALCGYFRSFEQQVEGPHGPEHRGYHKPIMIAGGMGNVREMHVDKNQIPAGAYLVVLGGPAMLIGLGGGAASSVASGTSTEDLDFASVQRENPEMERRCQEVIDSCWRMGSDNPIVSIHDVGAGGLSNALPELVHDSKRGGQFSLRAIPNEEPGMSPLEIWCNESQERYVLAVASDTLARFEAICQRERCPYAILGQATAQETLEVHDEHFEDLPIDLPMSVLFGKPPKMHRVASHIERPASRFDTSTRDIEESARRVLSFPTVASKSFLITIGDRSITGMVARDQMVGPWQVPVADVAVTTSTLSSYTGEAMAMGERTPVALLDPEAAGRLAIAETITNIAAASIESLGHVKLSANWMVAAGQPGEDAALYDTVRAIGMELCPALGLAIPVGKDSMSMKTMWQQDGCSHTVVSPLSLIVSGFAPVRDCRQTLTPELQHDQGETLLALIDLGRRQCRLGGSSLCQVYSEMGDTPPDLDDPALLRDFFTGIQALNAQGKLLAYHDRSDGGLWATLCEMAFAGRCGLQVEIEALGNDPHAALFNEELGAVLQIKRADWPLVQTQFADSSLAKALHLLGTTRPDGLFQITWKGKTLLQGTRQHWQEIWSRTSHAIAQLRDNSDCADQEFALLQRDEDRGLYAALSFDPAENPNASLPTHAKRPRVAILREQGVNGHIEMAAAFDRAGFEAVDVHMSDLLVGRQGLDQFVGLAACGGFSYGDVLGAGRGWAASILEHTKLREAFTNFFQRSDTFGLGVCNGCQMMSQLRDLIPGAVHWPDFVRNISERFEARTVLVEVQDSPSILLSGMVGSVMPIAVAHGEGRITSAPGRTLDHEAMQAFSCLRYVDHDGSPTTHYPRNPNGSQGGMTGFCNEDGRFTIMMPHPERVYRTIQHSWHPKHWGEDGPWMRMFHNARLWVG